MSETTLYSFQGEGHRVQVIRRETVTRRWALVDNRHVLVSSKDEGTIKRSFASHVQSIIFQMTLGV